MSYLGLLALVAIAGLLAEGVCGTSRAPPASAWPAVRSSGRILARGGSRGPRRHRPPGALGGDPSGTGGSFAQSPIQSQTELQSQLATVVLKSLVAWRAYVLLFRIYLRPAQPLLRIAPVGDASAPRRRHLSALFGQAVIAAAGGVTRRQPAPRCAA